MTPNLVPFLNLHYIYCVIYSWFGGRCTTLGSSALDAARAARESLNGIEIPSVNGVGSTTRALVPQVNTSWLDWLNPLSYGMSEGTSGSGGFWSWLNPFSTSAGAATDVARACRTRIALGRPLRLASYLGPVRCRCCREHLLLHVVGIFVYLLACRGARVFFYHHGACNTYHVPYAVA